MGDTARSTLGAGIAQSPWISRHDKPFSPTTRLMTLTPYDPKMLDLFTLRLLDLTAAARQMAQRSREHGIDDFALHDKKALEWIANLEHWTRKAAADLEVQILESRARQRATSRGQ